MPAKQQPFDVEAFLHSSGVVRTVARFSIGAVLFAQGDAADSVVYIQRGGVKLSVLSPAGPEEEESNRLLPKISQEVLAEMVGTTRSRVNFLMNKFRKLGLIDYNGGIKVNHSLLSLVLHD